MQPRSCGGSSPRSDAVGVLPLTAGTGFRALSRIVQPGRQHEGAGDGQPNDHGRRDAKAAGTHQGKKEDHGHAPQKAGYEKAPPLNFAQPGHIDQNVAGNWRNHKGQKEEHGPFFAGGPRPLVQQLGRHQALDQRATGIAGQVKDSLARRHRDYPTHQEPDGKAIGVRGSHHRRLCRQRRDQDLQANQPH